MKRSGFARKVYEPPAQAPLRAIERPPAYADASGHADPVGKECALQHQGYMNLVRAMPCARCGMSPRSEFCHADQGKGMGIKTDCRRGWPGCHDCHFFIGSTGTLSKMTRRALEDAYAHAARKKILSAGLWPANLPLWREA